MDMGFEIGERSAMDVTLIEICRDDPVGKWNDYYRKKIVKLVVAQDLDTLLPLAWKAIGDPDAVGARLFDMFSLVRD